MAKTIKRKIQVFLIAVFALALGAGFASMPKAKEAKAAVPTSYATVETSMMAQIKQVYNEAGRFNLAITMPDLDSASVEAGEYRLDTTALETDLPTILRNLGLYDHVKVAGKTLSEYGDATCYDNFVLINKGGPANYTITFPLQVNKDAWMAAVNSGDVTFTKYDGLALVTHMCDVEILEGALIPGYDYLTLGANPTVFKAGCDFVTEGGAYAYDVHTIAKTDVVSVTVAQDNKDGSCYFGVNLIGDDYAGSQLIVNQNYAYNYVDKISVNGNGVTGVTGKYGLYGLGSKGAGHYAFHLKADPTTMESITIPAGTLFPSRAMTTLKAANSNNSVTIFYETQVDKTFVKDENGNWYCPADVEEIATEVTMAVPVLNGGNNADYFVNFELSVNDYAGCGTYAGNVVSARDYFATSNIKSHVLINGGAFPNVVGETFLNVWGIQNVFSTRALVDGVGFTSAANISSITVLAGCKFPSYELLEKGTTKYYVTTADVTFVKNASGTWEKQAPVGGYDVTFMVDGNVHSSAKVESGKTLGSIWPADPTKNADSSYVYTFTHWVDKQTGKTVTKDTVVTANMTLEACFNQAEKPAEGVDVTSEISFVHQTQQNAGTETYMIKTENNYWTKAPLGGCLNEHDAQNAGGGQEQMKYIYLNGKSLYDINKEDNDSYGSAQGNIVSGGVYAPILVLMGSDKGKYSYVQLHVPTLYGGEGATANENHKSVEIKAGFSVTENNVTYVVTEDIKWINLNGVWANAKKVVSPDDITIGEGYIGGEEGELLIAEISSDKWNFSNRDPYDYNYYSLEDFVSMRKNIYINGVSIFEINTTVDDSSYGYVTSPQTNVSTGIYNENTYELFANPVFLYCKDNTIKVHVHIDYIKTLGAGDITITLYEGLQGFVDKNELSNPLNEKVVSAVSRNCSVLIEGSNQVVLKDKLATKPADPIKEMTATTIYAFDNWYNVATGEIFDFNAPITSDVEIEARFTETEISLISTEIYQIVYNISKTNNDDRWLIFYLSEHDYPIDQFTIDLNYDMLYSLNMLDSIIIKGNMTVGGKAKTEASMREIFDANGHGEATFFNIWNETYVGSLAFRMPGVSQITDIEIKAGCMLPSYNSFVNGDEKARLMTEKDMTYKLSGSQAPGENVLVPQASMVIDISMEAGAAVRLTSNMATSGLRFRTNVSEESLAMLQGLLNKEDSEYKKISFGTIIVPTEFLMGGLFTHEWLKANGYILLDVPSSVDINKNDSWALYSNGYYSFFGSIVELNINNYDREFSGIGYVKFELKDGTVEYYYAEYNSANSRSASFVADAAISDRSTEKSEEYGNEISAESWSPYTKEENVFLSQYITWVDVPDAIEPETLTNLAQKGGSDVVEIAEDKQKLSGAYVELLYSTNVDVWGVFTYTDGSKTANEDFYLQAGTTSHKQFLDIYRKNGVGYGMDVSKLKMTKITFTNAELENSDAPQGKFKILGFYSSNKSIDVDNQEIYLTVTQKDGSEITVGAHLGLGGALTYLAKSGIYEGVTNSNYKKGEVRLQTDTSGFVSERNIDWLGISKEKGYYGHATGSKPEDGVNLINNFDAGRQIQQSWYAEVGGDKTATDNENGYTRAFCKTESPAGKYWPYNPVQAGDVVSNPSQIIDYDITDDYIYVKTRAMDWAKGKGSDNLTNTISGGSTTKSYMENYYRLGSDGTLTVNNSFIDWNGFTDMELCAWAPTELPAVYPVHTLNYYVSNTNGDGTWTDGLEYYGSLGSWTGDAKLSQSKTSKNTNVEEWFAWANGNTLDSFALGVYIPNVATFTSGRSVTSTALSENANKNAKSENILSSKKLMSNMQPIQYTYQSAYVSNTSYTAPGVLFRMEAYVPIEYTYVICLGTVKNVRDTFHTIYTNKTVTNAGAEYQKAGLDAWARADKKWTW